MTRAPRVSERVEQQHIVQLLRTLGATVYVLGTVRKRGDYPGTMQTPGLPDLFVVMPAQASQRPVLWIEVKATGGRLSAAQRTFRAACLEAGLPHVVGGLDAVIAWLMAHGYLRETQVPHYRRPAAAQESA